MTEENNFMFTYKYSSGIISRILETRSGKKVISKLAIGQEPIVKSLEDAYDLTWLQSSKRPNIPSSGKEIKIADLFSGCGGMSLGIVESCRALNYIPKIVFACDVIEDYLKVYEKNLNPSIAYSQPIETIFDSEINKKLSKTEKKWLQKLKGIKLAAGGPPCQGHSDLNNHTRRNDPRNNLYAKMARFAQVVEPEHLIIENVLGVRHDKSGVYNQTLDALIKMGYNVDFTVIKGEKIGVPQRRHRAFIIASKTIKLYEGYFDKAIESYRTDIRTCKWALNDLLKKESRSPFDATSKLTSESQKRVDWLFENNEYDLPDSMRPSCHRDKDHTYNSVYGRLYWDKPAWTITTGFLVMGQGRFIHPKRKRVITPHEAARLQFFPDFFDFGDQSRHNYGKMIGNAVPPKMSFIVANELLR